MNPSPTKTKELDAPRRGSQQLTAPTRSELARARVLEGFPSWSLADGNMSEEELYSRYAKTVERFFANKAASNADVSDLMHITFVRFFERVQSEELVIDTPGKFLIGIARNVLFEYWRQKGKADRVDDIDKMSIAGLSNAPLPDSNAERTMLVRELLRELPFNHQLVLELHYWEHESYREIADLLGVPFGTATTWGHKGRLALEARMNELLRAPEQRTSRDGTQAPVIPPKNDVGAYGWYDPCTGAINFIELAIESMLGLRPKPKAADVPEAPSWLRELNLPSHMPSALPHELSEVARAAWHAWDAAGRPKPGDPP